jgi:hypothetical protein
MILNGFETRVNLGRPCHRKGYWISAVTDSVMLMVEIYLNMVE